jgi:polyisoprenoid-binding protein YceI
MSVAQESEMTRVALESVPVGTYTVDAVESDVGFEVKHMGLTLVRGAFRRFEGTVHADAGLVLQGTVDVSSIDSGDADTDQQLQGPEFFDAARFPHIAFTSTGAHGDSDGKLTLTGEITIKGTTQAIELIGALHDAAEDASGNARVGFEIQGTIDRREFGVKWNRTLPNGKLMIANDVRLIVTVSAVRES